MRTDLKNAADIVLDRCGFVPDLAMVLGSGLSSLAEEIEDTVKIRYGDLPEFPVSTAPGHVSEMVAGTLSGKKVLVLKGRFHFYEGYSLEQIVSPVRLLRHLGCGRLFLTNAAGGVNRNFSPGDLMLITDHINLANRNPLRGPNDPGLGDRFPDMSSCWSTEMGTCLREAAGNAGTSLREGVYGWLTGPSFETPAEIRMARFLGADAVGMSTVPEAIAAAHCGIHTAGVSCISNMAAGILDQPISEDEVMETGRRVRELFAAVVREFLRLLPDDISN
jgi:purine-nucleoside phosphorylase